MQKDMNSGISVRFHHKKPENIELGFVVIASRYDGRWVLVRHRERSTYEIPGGHIEQGEEPVRAAERELFEETGASDYALSFIGCYSVEKDGKIGGGYLYLADITAFSGPPAYETAERRLFNTLPSNLTYPDIQPYLHEIVQSWINMQNSRGELWDVYDKDRRLTGRTHRRGEFLAEGDYHLTVHVWIMNETGQFLVTKRASNKGYPNMWECTGGSALAGDDSLTAAIREVKEETGLDVLPERGKLILQRQGGSHFCDIWLFRQNFSLEDVVLQEGETVDVKWAGMDEIKGMLLSGEFVPFSYLDMLFTKISQLN